MSEIVLVCLINGLAFIYGDKRDNLFLWFLAAAADSAFGFYWAGTGDAGSALWVEGICIVALSGFCLYRIVANLWSGRGIK